ncbi:hypothetical protein Mapa_009130 [Marchantia paleacea]|nr:hypothetical protein Mapa_009130 [Marchantia paleacea]
MYDIVNNSSSLVVVAAVADQEKNNKNNNVNMVADKSISQDQDVLLPGFRFHPTDEELVGYYLRRKIMQKSLAVEVITQLDIYKFDPWDLPKMAVAKGEKEWYFFCPRDRKYRNSARPNRVTGAGFWKATGTDRHIYASGGSKTIGLKKSLVFYKGRAAKGAKTDWMMHEFRLPPSTDSPSSSKGHPEDNAIQKDAWAVCRIFKKSTLAQQRSANMVSQLWHQEMSPATEEMVTTEDVEEPQAGFAQSERNEICSSNVNLDLDSSEDRNESSSEDRSTMSIQPKYIVETTTVNQQQHQLKKEESTATWPLLPMDCPKATNNFDGNLWATPSLEMVNDFLAHENTLRRGALDCVNSILNVPNSYGTHGQFIDLDLLEEYAIEDPQYHSGSSNMGQLQKPRISSSGTNHYNSHMQPLNRKKLTLQIPSYPCAMQPWDSLSPIYDLPTSQLECM